MIRQAGAYVEKFIRLAGGLLIFLGVMTGAAAVTWGNTQVGPVENGNSCGSYWSPEKTFVYDDTTGDGTEEPICPVELGNGGAFAILLLLSGIGLVVFGSIAIAMTTGGSDESAEESPADDLAAAA